MLWAEYYENEQKEFERAQEMIKANPREAFWHYKLGTVYVSKLDFEEAYKCCKKAIELDPEGALFHIFMAYLHVFNDSNVKGAVDEIVAAIELIEEAKDKKVFNERKWYLTDANQPNGICCPNSQEKITLIESELEYYLDFVKGGLDMEIAESKAAVLRKAGKVAVADKLEDWIVKAKPASVFLPEFE